MTNGLAIRTLVLTLWLYPAIGGEEPFRPAAGSFPPSEKAHSYRGELVFVDHANRRGSLRIVGKGAFRRNSPSPFALLPYGMVRHLGAPADLRDIPLGTVLHALAYLPPDPGTSSVPVLPADHKEKKSRYGDVGSAPAENHLLLLEDEPSFCQREGLVWKLTEVEIQKGETTIVARRVPRDGAAGEGEAEVLTLDAATRIWRGRERLSIVDLIEEGVWPANGKKSLEDRDVLLGLVWKPSPGGVFVRFHVSDIWMDGLAMERATHQQNETHKAFVRSRWVPGWIDEVDYGEFGSATVTATLFGGIDDSIYSEFRAGQQILVNGVENTLKHTESGSAGPTQMAARGKILEVRELPGEPPLGSSGIQVRFEIDLITEGFRPARIVRMRPAAWPDLHLPREEHNQDSTADVDQRFPNPDIFPEY